MTTNTRTQKRKHTRKLKQVSVSRVRVSSIHPSPENEKLYRPVDPEDPEIIKLAESIQKHGIRERLVITRDRYILSGHRRHMAAKVAGQQTVPVRWANIRRDTNIDRFVELLREHNRQRDKTNAEKLREELITVNPEEAYYSLIEHRRQQSEVSGDSLHLNGRKPRSRISKAKQPFLKMVLAILDDLRKHWPVGERTIHYKLLNDPPLRHASKPDSRYRNDTKSSADLSNLCTRARIAGDIPFEAICDETRPVVTWNVHQGTRLFVREQLDGFLKGFWRDLMQSQPNHFEILCEKNTMLSFLRPVVAEFCMPVTSGRGFSSLPPRHEMAVRFKKSGKDKLVLIIVSDFDPSGESIAQSFAESMKHDFGIKNIHAVKAGLTYDQVQEMDLHTDFNKAKKTDPRYKAFVKKYGPDVFELEAVSPDTLQKMLRDTIDSLIDVDAFNVELDAEQEDAFFLEGVRRTAHSALRDIV